MRFFSTLIVMAIILFAFVTPAQTTQDYYIKFNANAVSDSVVKYEVYLQTQSNNSNWGIVDGADYTPSIETYKVTEITAVSGQTKYSYKVTLPLTGGWAVAGVIANNGIRSVVGASSSTKLLKKPGKPTGVVIETTP